MYQIFYEPRYLLIDQPGKTSKQEREVHFSKKVEDFFELFVEWTTNPSPGNARINHIDPPALFRILRSNCFHIKAAGGLVRSPENKILMIFRKGKWDLPKGKIDSKETAEDAAIREVTEECGIGRLEIISRLPETNHVYVDEKKRWVLKTTCWYHMITHDWRKPVPQTEEEIEQAIWVTKQEAEKLMENSYSSIAYLLKGVFAREAGNY